jgi:hypothetical protein
MKSRQHDVDRFYEFLHQLEVVLGGKRKLSFCKGRMIWPERGVYFFFEEGETRENGEPRVVRIGTHALSKNSTTTLWSRLSQHQGTLSGRHPGGGNHRGSVFRLHVGTAIIAREGLIVPTWSKGSSASVQIRAAEYHAESKVSAHINQMPFLWLSIDDEPGPSSVRGCIERNAIALLSNYAKKLKIDPPSMSWLGNLAWRDKIREAGLWNVNHVDEEYNSSFLDILKMNVAKTGRK